MIGVGWGVGGMLLPVIGHMADIFDMRLALTGVAAVSAATAALALVLPLAGPKAQEPE